MARRPSVQNVMHPAGETCARNDRRQHCKYILSICQEDNNGVAQISVYILYTYIVQGSCSPFKPNALIQIFTKLSLVHTLYVHSYFGMDTFGSVEKSEKETATRGKLRRLSPNLELLVAVYILERDVRCNVKELFNVCLQLAFV